MSPDMTMCKGFNCGKKNECYRYRAFPDQYQSFFSEKPTGCFLKIRSGDRIREVGDIEKDVVITLDVQDSILGETNE